MLLTERLRCCRRGKSPTCRNSSPQFAAWEMSHRFATPEVVESVLIASVGLDPKEIKEALRAQ